MAYYTAYYTNYFDVEAVEEAVRRVFGHYVTEKEWREYLRTWHKRREEELALKVSFKEDLRKAMFGQVATVSKRIQRAKRIAEQPEIHEYLAPVQQLPLRLFNVEPEMRRLLAQRIKAIRKRAKRLRRQRDEEAILLLI